MINKENKTMNKCTVVSKNRNKKSYNVFGCVGKGEKLLLAKVYSLGNATITGNLFAQTYSNVTVE